MANTIERQNRMINRLLSLVNEDDYISNVDINDTIKDYFAEIFAEVPSDKRTLARIQWVREHTGKLLYVRTANEVQLYKHLAKVRGYVNDNGVIEVNRLLTPPKFDSTGKRLTDAEKILYMAKARRWLDMVSSYAKNRNMQRSQLLCDKQFGAPYYQLVPSFSPKQYSKQRVIDVLSQYADKQMHVDGVNKYNNLSYMCNWCMRYYAEQGIDYLTPKQSLHKFVADNTNYTFERKIIVPASKDEVHQVDLYEQAVADLIKLAGDKHVITTIKQVDNQLYNRVRHIRDMLGYDSIEECINSMLANHEIKYRPVRFYDRKRVNDPKEIDKLIYKYYVEGKDPSEIKYHNKMLDVSKMSSEHGDLYHKVCRQWYHINNKRTEKLTMPEYLEKYHNCYFNGKDKLNVTVLKNSNPVVPVGKSNKSVIAQR